MCLLGRQRLDWKHGRPLRKVQTLAKKLQSSLEHNERIALEEEMREIDEERYNRGK